jgi:tetratricopeptide (TPR) repeat protein
VSCPARGAAGAPEARRRPALRIAVLLALVVLAAADPARGASRPRLKTTAGGGAAAQPAALDIRFDLEVVDRLGQFRARGAATAEELDAWVRLPGNRELLRQGRLERTLTPDILITAARAVITGGAFDGPPTLGRLPGGDWGDLDRIVAALRTDGDALAASASAALMPYLPAGRTLPPLLVYFHLGGSWDGRTTDAVYINLTFFQARGYASLPGLDALLVHELFHVAQGALLPSVEDYGSRQSALYTLLLRTEQEGIARHLEYRRLREQAVGTEMDRTNLARYEDGLRRSRENAALLARFQGALDARRMDEVRRIASEGFLGGGPLYSVGHAMAGTIETQAGTAALAATVVAGPLAFTRAYLQAAGEESLIPDGIIAAIGEVERGYGRNPFRASRLRRDGLRWLVDSRPADAIEILKQAVRLDPTDAISAYNLACAWALLGREKKSLRWLAAAFDRGFTDYKHAANDEDFTNLRARPEFAALLRSRGLDYRRPAAPIP